MSRSRTAVVTGVAVALLGPCLTTSAHAQVTPGVQTLATTHLAYRMSVDRSGLTPDEQFTSDQLRAKHNRGLTIRYPAGFKVRDCHAPRSFRCAHSDTRVWFSRNQNSRDFDNADRFEVEVRVPGIRGIYRTPALQVFSDGTQILWDGAESDAYPAPSVAVEGRDRAPRVARGTFELLGDVDTKIPCPRSVVVQAKQREIDPERYCEFEGYAPPNFPRPSAASFGPARWDASALPADGGSGSDHLEGTASLRRGKDRTWLTVRVSGLEPGMAYAAHLHEGTCAETSSPHYKHNEYGPSTPPNELWPSTKRHDRQAGLVADHDGKAVGRAAAHWKARATARSVWIHEGSVPSAPGGGEHAHHQRLACADLS